MWFQVKCSKCVSFQVDISPPKKRSLALSSNEGNSKKKNKCNGVCLDSTEKTSPNLSKESK